MSEIPVTIYARLHDNPHKEETLLKTDEKTNNNPDVDFRAAQEYLWQVQPVSF